MKIEKLPWRVLVCERCYGGVGVDQFIALVHEGQAGCIGIYGIEREDHDAYAGRPPEPGRIQIFQDQRGLCFKLFEQYWAVQE